MSAIFHAFDRPTPTKTSGRRPPVPNRACPCAIDLFVEPRRPLLHVSASVSPNDRRVVRIGLPTAGGKAGSPIVVRMDVSNSSLRRIAHGSAGQWHITRAERHSLLTRPLSRPSLRKQFTLAGAYPGIQAIAFQTWRECRSSRRDIRSLKFEVCLHRVSKFYQ